MSMTKDAWLDLLTQEDGAQKNVDARQEKKDAVLAILSRDRENKSKDIISGMDQKVSQGTKKSVQKTVDKNHDQKQEFDWDEQKDLYFGERSYLKIIEGLEKAYALKEASVGTQVLRYIEKEVTLRTLDQHWREHLAAMDYMRQGIFLRSYAQKNPKQEYKREAFELFSAMLDRIKFDTVTTVSRIQVRSEEEIERETLERQQRLAQALQLQHAEAVSPIQGPGAGEGAPGLSPAAENIAEMDPRGAPAGTAPFVRAMPKVGRNEPCPCGSGRKYKHCHGALQQANG